MAVGRNVDVSIGSPVCAVTVGAKEGATLGLAMVGGEGAFDAFPRFGIFDANEGDFDGLFSFEIDG